MHCREELVQWPYLLLFRAVLEGRGAELWCHCPEDKCTGRSLWVTGPVLLGKWGLGLCSQPVW